MMNVYTKITKTFLKNQGKNQSKIIIRTYKKNTKTVKTQQ